jgi:uncharacterized protein YbbK (DUF523 family)
MTRSSMSHASHLQRPIRVGISSCLLGETVGFDGGHKRDAFLTETFGRFVEWVQVCPEVECGLGTPRESMRLVRVGDAVRLLTVKTGVDFTDRLVRYARERVAQLASQDLCGFVLKKDSPRMCDQPPPRHRTASSPLPSSAARSVRRARPGRGTESPGASCRFS